MAITDKCIKTPEIITRYFINRTPDQSSHKPPKVKTNDILGSTIKKRFRNLGKIVK